MRRLIVLLAATLYPFIVHGADQIDPLRSSRWGDMKREFFRDQAVVFDDRVQVLAPKIAEDSLNVPVAVKVEGLPEVREIMVFADFNPILKVLEFYPQAVEPYVAFRLKLQQSSPVRAAARTADGIWHVGGAWVTAAGGGCTAPSAGRTSGNWSKNLNQVSARLWDGAPERGRLKLRVLHPMDTGLAPGIPAFFIEKLELRDDNGKSLLQINTYEPISENPVLSFNLGDVPSSGKLALTGVDNNGNKIDASITQ